MSSFNDACEYILKKLEADGYKRVKARAEMFGDVINAFNIIQEHNNDKEGDEMIRLISPTIKGSVMMDAEFDFWTKTPIKTIQTLWDTKGINLHRIIQTIKPYGEYTGEVDNTFWKTKRIDLSSKTDSA